MSDEEKDEGVVEYEESQGDQYRQSVTSTERLSRQLEGIDSQVHEGQEKENHQGPVQIDTSPSEHPPHPQQSEDHGNTQIATHPNPNHGEQGYSPEHHEHQQASHEHGQEAKVENERGFHRVEKVLQEEEIIHHQSQSSSHQAQHEEVLSVQHGHEEVGGLNQNHVQHSQQNFEHPDHINVEHEHQNPVPDHQNEGYEHQNQVHESPVKGHAHHEEGDNLHSQEPIHQNLVVEVEQQQRQPEEVHVTHQNHHNPVQESLPEHERQAQASHESDHPPQVFVSQGSQVEARQAAQVQAEVVRNLPPAQNDIPHQNIREGNGVPAYQQLSNQEFERPDGQNLHIQSVRGKPPKEDINKQQPRPCKCEIM